MWIITIFNISCLLKIFELRTLIKNGSDRNKVKYKIPMLPFIMYASVLFVLSLGYETPNISYDLYKSILDVDIILLLILLLQTIVYTFINLDHINIFVFMACCVLCCMPLFLIVLTPISIIYVTYFIINTCIIRKIRKR